MDADDLIRRRARSFGATAAEYARHRPDYPPDGIRWGLAATSREVRQVVDLAAGTGKLTGGLITLGLEVTAVEPDEEMLAQLSADFPDVAAHAGTAEHIPLPAATADAVLVGQAFHWFDHDAALTDIGRVLRPGGALVALWNDEDETAEWVLGLRDLSSSSVSKRWSTEYLTFAHVLFETSEQTTVPHAHRRTADSLVEMIGTKSHTLVISARERAEMLGRIRDYLASRPETASGEFDLPLHTTVHRARRCR